jgi:hypothetical protein
MTPAPVQRSPLPVAANTPGRCEFCQDGRLLSQNVKGCMACSADFVPATSDKPQTYLPGDWLSASGMCKILPTVLNGHDRTLADVRCRLTAWRLARLGPLFSAGRFELSPRKWSTRLAHAPLSAWTCRQVSNTPSRATGVLSPTCGKSSCGTKSTIGGGISRVVFSLYATGPGGNGGKEDQDLHLSIPPGRHRK